MARQMTRLQRVSPLSAWYMVREEYTHRQLLDDGVSFILADPSARLWYKDGKSTVGTPPSEWDENQAAVSYTFLNRGVMLLDVEN